MAKLELKRDRIESVDVEDEWDVPPNPVNKLEKKEKEKSEDDEWETNPSPDNLKDPFAGGIKMAQEKKVDTEDWGTFDTPQAMKA